MNLAAAILFSTIAFAQNHAFAKSMDKGLKGRLIDLVCGSMTLRAKRYVVIHSASCLNDPKARGGLAVVLDRDGTLVRLTREQEKTAIAFRRDLARGEVHVIVGKDGKIQQIWQELDETRLGKECQSR